MCDLYFQSPGIVNFMNREVARRGKRLKFLINLTVPSFFRFLMVTSKSYWNISFMIRQKFEV